MYIFLISFLALYGGMHLYAFCRLRTACSFRPACIRLLIAWMSLMTGAPLLVRFLERAGMDPAALIIAWPGYLWMGFLFILVSILLLTDALRAVVWLVRRLISARPLPPLPAGTFCSIALVMAGAASGYACFEARQIRSEHVVITSSKLQPNNPPIRIVQISDVHIGLLLREGRMERILKIVRNAQPDILVSTGDLLDGKLNREDVVYHQSLMAAMLADVTAPLGKFAVTGNHEVYAGLSQALAFTSAAGFMTLQNTTVQVADSISITGIDDKAADGRTKNSRTSETALLAASPQNRFRLLLKHRPEISATSDGRFDLQLSGHVHGGQLFPFNYLVRLKYPLPCGTTTTKAGSLVHISRGTGTWGPPMRLFAPPEITIIDVVPEKPVQSSAGHGSEPIHIRPRVIF